MIDTGYADKSQLISITFQLSSVHSYMLRKPIRGQGGWQDFLRKLQKKLTDTNTITLSYTEIRKIYRYSNKYGGGGFEQRLEGILSSIKDATNEVVTSKAIVRKLSTST